MISIAFAFEQIVLASLLNSWARKSSFLPTGPVAERCSRAGGNVCIEPIELFLNIGLGSR